MPQGPSVYPGRDHQAGHRRAAQGALSLRAQDVQHDDSRGQDQGCHRQGRQGHPGDVRQLQLQDRHRGGRPRLHLCRGSGGRQAGHRHHQDHCGGPRDRCHLQGPGHPPDESSVPSWRSRRARKAWFTSPSWTITVWPMWRIVVAVGDPIFVMVTDIDQQGRINLSRKDALAAIAKKRAAQQQ